MSRIVACVVVVFVALGALMRADPQPAPLPSPVLPRPVPAPPEPAPHPSGERLVVRQDRDHQCYLEARVNGVSLRFLIDTGAWTLAFGPQHLRILGLDRSSLIYDRKILTANGTARAADIRVSELRIGSLVLRNLAGQVNEHGDGDPLLGASVLKLLRLEVADGQCVLTLPPRR